MKRPVGVTILAILCFVGAALAADLALARMLLGGQLTLAAGSLAAAFICLLFGLGLWKLRSWARTWTMIFAGFAALAPLLRLLESLVAFEPAGVVFQLAYLGFCLWIVSYMLRPHVKQSFGVDHG